MNLKSLRNLSLAIALAFVGATVAPAPAHAAPLSAARATASKGTGFIKSYLMKASTTVYAGGMVMLDSNGVGLPAAASASAKGVVGVAIETKTSAGSGSTYVQVQEGWFLLDGTSLGQSNQGALCWASDDHTVVVTRAANQPIAGLLIQYVTSSTAWVYVGPVFSGRSVLEPDTLTVDGTATIAGTLVTTGATNGPSGATRQLTTPLALTAAMSGQLIVVSSTADAATVVTLPPASTAGLHYCFVADSVTGSNREADIEPQGASDIMVGTTNPAGGTGIATTAGPGHGMKNTHATAVRGNGLCVQSDGVNTYYQTYLAGTWAGY